MKLFSKIFKKSNSDQNLDSPYPFIEKLEERDENAIFEINNL